VLEMLLQALLARLLVDMELYWLSTSPDPVGLSSVVSKSRYSCIHNSKYSGNCWTIETRNNCRLTATIHQNLNLKKPNHLILLQPLLTPLSQQVERKQKHSFRNRKRGPQCRN